MGILDHINIFTRKIRTRKFYYIKISRSTGLHDGMLCMNIAWCVMHECWHMLHARWHGLSNECYRHVRNIVHVKFDTDHPHTIWHIFHYVRCSCTSAKGNMPSALQHPEVYQSKECTKEKVTE